MSEIEVIESVVTKTARRHRWQRAWLGAWNGLLLGAILWLIVIVLQKVFPISISLVMWTGAVAFISVLAGFSAGWFRQITPLEAARWLDRTQHLHERLSTALEITQSQKQNTWRDLVVTDAARSASTLRLKALLPFRVPQISQWALLCLILAAGLGFVPEYRSKEYLQKKQETEIIRDTGQRLAELTRRSLEQRTPALEPTRQALDTVAELGDHLAKANLTRTDALKDLASVTEKIKEQAHELGRNPALKSMERAARSAHKAGTPGNADLQKQIESLEKTLGNAAADSKALEKLKEDLQKAKQAAAGLPNSNSPDTAEARQQLADSLANLSQQAKDLGLSLPSLEEAIAALSASQTDQLLKDLAIAETDLEKLSEMAKALEKLQATATQIGKDLPEQLENGQPDAAQSTLQKMARQLRSAQLSSEQAQRILDEVSRAVAPAGNYGKVADLLKQATQQLQSNNPQAAAQSLQDAAKELENLMEQLGDAQSMMASLNALQRAQMSIGNSQKWSMCKGPPKAGQSGGLGSGVGTWADDSQFLDIDDIKDRWDNSGVVRPDQDARGITDRGDAQLADNLESTKIRGQINPGGPMPSITLKGVSIKGMSKVSYQEAVTAAQTEAQSAINQDQVPRAYRGAVRDYFNDLKE